MDRSVGHVVVTVPCADVVIRATKLLGRVFNRRGMLRRRDGFSPSSVGSRRGERGTGLTARG